MVHGRQSVVEIGRTCPVSPSTLSFPPPVPYLPFPFLPSLSFPLPSLSFLNRPLLPPFSLTLLTPFPFPHLILPSPSPSLRSRLPLSQLRGLREPGRQTFGLKNTSEIAILSQYLASRCVRCDHQVLSTRLSADIWLSIDDFIVLLLFFERNKWRWRLLELVLSTDGGPSSGVSQTVTVQVCLRHRKPRTSEYAEENRTV